MIWETLLHISQECTPGTDLGIVLHKIVILIFLIKDFHVGTWLQLRGRPPADLIEDFPIVDPALFSLRIRLLIIRSSLLPNPLILVRREWKSVTLGVDIGAKIPQTSTEKHWPWTYKDNVSIFIRLGLPTTVGSVKYVSLVCLDPISDRGLLESTALTMVLLKLLLLLKYHLYSAYTVILCVLINSWHWK